MNATTNHLAPTRGARTSWAVPTGAAPAVAQHLVGLSTAGASLKTTARRGTPWRVAAVPSRVRGSDAPLLALPHPATNEPPPRRASA